MAPITRQDLETGKVEIVSMNYGFTVDPSSCRAALKKPSLALRWRNSGLKVAGKPIISVQHHPEASPGPQDSFTCSTICGPYVGAQAFDRWTQRRHRHR